MRFALALLLLTGFEHLASARAAKDYFIQVELIAASAEPKPGDSMLVGLRMVPTAGWHSYWENPGEAGFPTVVKWSAPDGVSFGPLRHPAPSMIEVAGMTSFVHEGPHVLLSRMTIGRDVEAGTPIPVSAEVSWGACSDRACVPERATLSLDLKAGDGTPSPHAGLLRSALARVPARSDGGTFAIEDGALLLQLPASASVDASRARFFPDENGIVAAGGARVVSPAPLRISTPVVGEAPEILTGVVSDGSSAYRVSFEPGVLEALAPAAANAPIAAEAVADRAQAPVAPAATAERTAEAIASRPNVDRTATAEESRIAATAGAGILAGMALLALAFLRRARRS